MSKQPWHNATRLAPPRKNQSDIHLCVILDQPHDITTTPVEPQPILPVESPPVAVLIQPTPHQNQHCGQGCQIGCRTKSFDRSYATAKKSSLIRHSFLKLSMQNRSWSNYQWPTVVHALMHGFIAIQWWSATVKKICTRATCYYVGVCDFSLSLYDKWRFYS